jgi:hypothetical protein
MGTPKLALPLWLSARAVSAPDEPCPPWKAWAGVTFVKINKLAVSDNSVRRNMCSLLLYSYIVVPAL